MGEVRVEVAEVAHDLRVELLHQARLAGGVEDVIAGQDDVIIAAVHRGQLLVHLLVAGKGRVVDLDAGLLLKGLDDRLVVDIALPGEDVEHSLVLLVDGFRHGAGAHHHERQQQSKKLLHVVVLLAGIFVMQIHLQGFGPGHKAAGFTELRRKCIRHHAGLLGKSHCKASASGTERRDSQSIVGNASGIMPVIWMRIASCRCARAAAGKAPRR